MHVMVCKTSYNGFHAFSRKQLGQLLILVPEDGRLIFKMPNLYLID